MKRCWRCLFLTSFRERHDELSRAWKGHDWDALGRLFEKGLISNPVSKAKAVVLSEDGYHRAEAAFRRLFCPARGESQAAGKAAE